MQNKRYGIICMLIFLLFTSFSVAYAEKDPPTTATKLLVLCYQAKHLYNNLEKFVLPKDKKVQSITPLYAAVGGAECFGYVMEMPKKIYVVFRGTESYSDILKDFMIWKTPFKYVPNGGYVHSGFFSIYDDTSAKQRVSLREQVINKLKELDSNKQLIVTGFSLGGALATLCAGDIVENTEFKDPAVYTFASPRVGDQNFVSAFNQKVRRSVRIINYYDYVPCNPFYLLGYRHVKGEVLLRVNTGRMDLNHKMTSAYFPGLAANTPDYLENKLKKKDANLCPPLPETLPSPSWEEKGEEENKPTSQLSSEEQESDEELEKELERDAGVEFTDNRLLPIPN